MKKNIGTADRFVLVILGVIAIILGLSGILDANLKWIALVVGLVMITVASVQFCPFYVLFGINTCKVKSKK